MASSGMPLHSNGPATFATSGGTGGKRRRFSRVISSSYAGSNPARPSSGNSRIVTMLDPLEAKRLAAVEMERIKFRAKLKRRREIEAINGGWAMLGLTSGIIIESHTGKSIPDQVIGYVNLANAMISQFTSHF
ncbi:uncharacterized protein LOC9637678 isoform X1 [Selaginella moellendorffii]|uniref:uncharacterized protein LOC9637678 isoform X1 n=1 Tax=Selaginella moellendorffii TaxID=88036 RepID=UPI000D1C74E2|nr:uncharacterized protein LOC9637678 isoform X1 [Selaginella moellendorffii]|eukprot:XP_024535243.1 uncharacterized protein LOC9637678 isoform X1 [Selaginella moellendorffii]